MDFVVFKRGRPYYIEIGKCIYPYPTGNSEIVECSEDYIRIKTPKGYVKVINPESVSKYKNKISSIISQNPSNNIAPSLSSLSIYFLPNSSIFRKIANRNCASSILLNGLEGIKREIKLKPSDTITPEGLGIKNAKNKILKTSATGKYKKSINCTISAAKDKVIKVLIDPSIPNISLFKNYFSSQFKQKVEFTVPDLNNYQASFTANDIWLGWLSPAFLSSYDLLSVFDCNNSAPCFFNWHNSKLNLLLGQLMKSFNIGKEDINLVVKIENEIIKNSYAIPIAEMNWWISDGNRYKTVHPGGLTKLRISDFFY